MKPVLRDSHPVATWAGRFLITLLGGEAVAHALAPGLLNGHPTGDALLLLAGAVLFCGWLVLAPAAIDPPSGPRAALLTALLGTLADLALTGWHFPGLFPGLLPLKAAFGVALLLFALSGLARLIAPFAGGPGAALWWTLLACAIVASAPLWAGPLLDTRLPVEAAVDPLIAFSPLTYLASLMDWDYLRGEWFYRHSPFGGMRYSYPPPLGAGLAWLALGLAGWLRTSPAEPAPNKRGLGLGDGNLKPT
ncbi:MAG TPA: hypothetical protein ENK50_03660 [Sedimenticola sp.]|nr:hypothetical protein [Sedimenticola sp.]